MKNNLPILMFWFVSFVSVKSQNWEELNKMVTQSFQEGNIEKAFEYAQKAIVQSEKEFGTDHQNYAESLNNLGFLYYLTSQYDKAELHFIKSVELFRKISKEDNAELATSIGNLASFYDKTGKMRDAEKLYLEALKMKRKIFKIEHPDLALIINNVGYFYYSIGQYDKADTLYIEALEMYKHLYHGDDLNKARTINNLAVLYNASDRYNEAEEYYNESLEMRKRLYMGDNEDIASSMNNLGMFYSKTGRYDKADSLLHESLAMYRRLYKGDNEDLALIINNVGGFYQNIGKQFEAEKLYLEALEMRKRLFRGDSPDIAQSYNNLGAFYYKSGDYYKAEYYFKESLELRRRIYKGDHPHLATSIIHLAMFYYQFGIKSEAEPLYREALEMARRLYKNETEDLAIIINSVAVFDSENGKIYDAEKLFKETLSIYTRLYKGIHPDIARTINNLASFYDHIGRYMEAEPLYINALKMYRDLYKDDQPELATMINNVGYFYNGIELYDKAKPLFEEALAMKRRIYKGSHTELVTSISNLASINVIKGQYDDAETLYDEALSMSRSLYKIDNPNLASVINNFGFYYYTRCQYNKAELLFLEALKMRRNLFKNGHIDLTISLDNIINLLNLCNRYDESAPFYKELFSVVEELISNNALSMTENELNQFNNLFKKYYYSFCSYVSKMSLKKELRNLNKELFDSQLFAKSLLLNTSLSVKTRINNSNDRNLIKKYEEWKFLRNKIAQLYSLSEEQRKNRRYNIDSLRQIAYDQEKELSKLSSDFNKGLINKKYNYSDIQNCINHNEIVIEIVQFKYFNEKSWTDTICYAAVILSKESLNPEFVLLPNGKFLENEMINRYNKLIGDLKTEYETKQNITNKEFIDKTLKELYTNFWEKIQDKLQGIKTVYISLDGVYNKINLNTLINPKTGKYLADEIDLRILTSTRDLVNRNNIPINPLSRGERSAELFGDPKFNLDTSEIKEIISKYAMSQQSKGNISSNYQILRDGTIDTLTRGKSYEALPGTKSEINTISDILKSKGWTVGKHLEKEATEEAVKSVKSPTVLHVATHGEFTEDLEKNNKTETSGLETKRYYENPLLRSKLILAGGENTRIRLTKKEYQEARIDDGYLTAYEVMNMNLDNTELVVLSACETGLGKIKNGEGVYGLQRAFQVAGAKNIIMSLWKVPDEPTRELMTKFYSKWLNGSGKREAFREAQQELGVKYPNFFYWGAFVMIGP